MTYSVPPAKMPDDSTCDNCTNWVPTLRSRSSNICFAKTAACEPDHDWGNPEAPVVLTGPKETCDKFRRRSS